MTHDVKNISRSEWQYLRFSTDHKVIGVQYMLCTFFFFLVGGLLAMLIRAELVTPASNLVDRPLYNSLFTMHGTIMIFLWIIPFNAGLGNYLVPLMIGAKDMAFPLLNAISFWMIPPAGLLLLSSFLLPNGPSKAGWWSYPPVSLQFPPGQFINGEFIWIVSLLIIGISSILGAVNFVTTIFWMRAPGMTFFRMPVFVWSILSAQLLQLINLPALTGALILLLFDLSFGTQFFKPLAEGDPIIYQHLFWFYSHPAVYIMALPAFGIFAEVLPAFARNPLFGYRSLAIASLGIALVSIFVWVHHMFTSATPGWMRTTFMVTSMLVAVPTGVKAFGWVATIWKGKLHLETPFGFTVFLLSESIIFLSFIFTYVALRLTTKNWLPPGVTRPELSKSVIINTIILLSSSFVIQPAENALNRRNLSKFRLLWLITICMGSYFVISQLIEWKNLNFGLSTGLVGSTFYVLTGFHGLHVLTGLFYK